MAGDFWSKGLVSIIPRETKRRPATPFGHVAVPLAWQRCHVPFDDLPSEGICNRCKLWMMPIMLSGGERQGFADFPLSQPATGNVPGSTLAREAEPWACFKCGRAVMMTR